MWLFHLKDQKYRLEAGILLERNFGDGFKHTSPWGTATYPVFYLQFDNFYGLAGCCYMILELFDLYKEFYSILSRLIHLSYFHSSFVRVGTFSSSETSSLLPFLPQTEGEGGGREDALANSPMHTLMHRPLRLMLILLIVSPALMLFLHPHRPWLIRSQINRIAIHQLLSRTDNIRNESIQ